MARGGIYSVSITIINYCRRFDKETWDFTEKKSKELGAGRKKFHEIQLCLPVDFSVLCIYSCHFAACCCLIIPDTMPIIFCVIAINQMVQPFPVCLSDRIMFLVTFTTPLIFPPFYLHFEMNCRNKIYLLASMKDIREEINFNLESDYP